MRKCPHDKLANDGALNMARSICYQNYETEINGYRGMVEGRDRTIAEQKAEIDGLKKQLDRMNKTDPKCPTDPEGACASLRETHSAHTRGSRAHSTTQPESVLSLAKRACERAKRTPERTQGAHPGGYVEGCFPTFNGGWDVGKSFSSMIFRLAKELKLSQSFDADGFEVAVLSLIKEKEMDQVMQEKTQENPNLDVLDFITKAFAGTCKCGRIWMTDVWYVSTKGLGYPCTPGTLKPTQKTYMCECGRVLWTGRIPPL